MKFSTAVCLLMLLMSGCAGRQAYRGQQTMMVPADCVPSQPYAAYYSPEAGMIPANGYQADANPGFFGRLMEMERRKNAWLRRTFIGE